MALLPHLSRVLIIGTIAISTSSFACPTCTILMLKGTKKSGVVASARTVDFNVPIDPKIDEVPRGMTWKSRGDSIDTRTGINWTNQYGFIGLSASRELSTYLDGLNEKGLSAALLWLEETKYMERKGSNDLAALDLVAYLLGKCATAEEAKEEVKRHNIYATHLNGYAIPLHLVVMDAAGESFVAEWINGQLNIFDKATTKGYTEVLTNSPTYDKQLANLNQYSHLNCYHLGNTYSLDSMPGNSSSMSRFVRAAKLKECTEQLGGAGDFLVNTEDEAMERLSVVIGRFDKPAGEVVLEDDPLQEGITLSYTRISLIKIHGKNDEKGKATSKLYFRTPDNPSLRVIDLSKINFAPSGNNKSKIKSFYVDSPLYKKAQEAIPVTN